MADTLRAVDTNVLLRYLVEDIPDQAARARRLVESGQPLGVTAVVLAEIAWTFAGPNYRIGRAGIVRGLAELLSRDNIVAIGFDKAEGQAALLTCAPPIGAANFGDALIAACARSAGIQEIYSFDRRFGRAGLSAVTPS